MLKSKTKNRLKFALLMSLVAIVLCGIGLGIYFIVISRSPSELLSPRERSFGNAIKSSSLVAEEKQINMIGLSEDLQDENIIFISDQFAVCFDGVNYSFYSFELAAFVDITAEADNIELLVGNVVVLWSGNDKLVYDLKNLAEICDLSNAVYEVCGNRLLIKSANGGDLNFKENGENVTDLKVVLFDAVNISRDSSFTHNDNIIDVKCEGDYLIVLSASETAIYKLDQTLTKVIGFENTLNESSIYNIASVVSSKTYLGLLYNKVYSLSKNLFLIEKTYSVSQQQFMIRTKLSDNSEKYFSISYLLFDAASGLKYDFTEPNNIVLSAISTKISDDYIAIVRSELVNKTYSADASKSITYYEIAVVDDELVLYPIVTYDYVKYGKIIGFVGTKLLTAGGTSSDLLSFNGESSNSLSLEYGQKITSEEFSSNSFVVTSVSGLKGVMDADGKTLHQSIYTKISPLMDNHYIAKCSDGYYLLDQNGGRVKIQTFAAQYENYVFAGIGYYLTSRTDNTFNVYNMDGTIKYASVDVLINYQSASRQVILNVVGQKILYITPIKAIDQTSLESASVQNFGSVKNVKSTVVNDSDFTFVGTVTSEVDTDEMSGIGKIDVAYDVDVEGNFRAYANLSACEKALIPAFDEDVLYNDTVNSKTYTFVGAYFVKIPNGVLAVIKLLGDDNNYYYMLNFAFTDSYLQGLEVSYSAAGTSHNAVYFDAYGIHDQGIDLATDPCAASALNYLVGMISEQNAVSSRIINYEAAGLDGGVVFMTDVANAISVNLTLQNAYHVSDINSDVTDWNDLSDGDILDLGHYTLTIEKTELTKKLTMQAKSGYFFTNAEFVSVIDDGSLSGDAAYQEISTLDSVCTTFEVSFNNISEDKFQIVNLCMVERYNFINLFDEDKETSLKDSQTFYFYGYANDISAVRNPAAFGFNNFYRAKNNITHVKDGYDFTGFAFNDGETDYQVFDSEGEFVLANKNLFAYAGNNIEAINLFATYEAKQYTITYKSNGSLIAGEQTNVTFDQEIGVLFDPVGTAYDRDGYNFRGWRYGEVTLTSETIYKYPQNIEVQAVWEAKTYTVTFLSNLSTYASLSVGGFTYKVTDVYLANDFSGALAGDSFNETQKSITFGQTYGILPELIAQNTEGTNTIKFTFLGWYENAGRADKGVHVTSDTTVSSTPITTLYAHYARDLYNANLSVNASEYIVNQNGDNVTPFKRMTYQGASDTGAAASYSTLEAAGYTTWTPSEGIYKLYDLRSENLVLGIVPNDGYYVSSVSVKIYSADGSYQTKVLNGNYNIDNHNYNITSSYANLQCLASGTDVTVTFVNIEGAYQNHFADITVNFAVKEYKNTITMAKDTQRNGEEITATGFTLAALNSATHSGIKYGTATKYSLNIPSVTTYGLNSKVQNSYLSKFKVGSIEITFTPTYSMQRIDLYYYKLVSSSESTQTVTDQTITDTYTVGGVTLNLIYNISDQTYAYNFITTNVGDNYAVTLTLADAMFKVALNISNKSNEGNINDVVVSGREYVGNSVSYTSLTGVTNGFTKNNVWSGNTVLFKISTNPGCFVDNITIGANGTVYNIARSLMGFNVSGLNISNTFITVSDRFTNITNGRALIGGGIFVTFNDGTYQIGVSKAFGDVSVNVQVRNYTILQVDVADAEDGSFELTISDGAAGYVNKTFASAESNEPANFVSEKVGNVINYVIYGKETSVTALALVTVSTEGVANKITASSGAVTVASDNENAEVVRSSYFGSVTVEEINRSMNIVSNLGTGENTYKQELADTEIYVSYYNSLGSYVQDSHYTENSAITFAGRIFGVKVYDITGYKFNSITLKNQNNEIINPSNANYNTKQTDAHGSYYQYEYQLDNLNFMSFTLTIAQDAIKYTIQYSYKENLGSSAVTGETANSVHYYNVPSALSENGYEKIGYTFVGYSLDVNAVSGTYASGQTLNVNLSTTDNDTVTLYAIFIAKEYNIIFDSNDTVGTVTAQEDTSVEFEDNVTFDNTFGTLKVLTRVGYTFVGWFTSAEGDNEVLVGNSFNYGLYNDEETEINEETLPKPTITLYAHWTKNSYILNYVNNDGDGSSRAETDDSVMFVESVTFDDVFGTLKVLTRLGYTFNGWYTNISGGSKIESTSILTYSIYNVFSGNGAFSDTEVDRHITLYAHWTVKTYTISYNNNDVVGSTTATGSGGVGWVRFDNTFNALRNLTRTGYNFVGWFTRSDDSGTQVLQGYAFDLSTIGNFKFGDYDTLNDRESIVLYAHWQKKEYTIVYDCNKGSGSSEPTTTSNTYSVYFDTAFDTLFETDRNGYDFDGWFSNLTDGTEIMSETVLNNTLYNTLKNNGNFSDTVADRHVTLYAHWSQREYKIIYDYNKADNTTSDPTQSDDEYFVTFDGTFPTLFTTSRNGYNFVGWFTSVEGDNQVIAGSTFVDDLYSDAETEINETVSPNPTITLYAHWEERIYSIVYNKNDDVYGFGSTRATIITNGAANIMFDNDFATLRVLKRVGYDFAGWFTSAESGDEVSAGGKFDDTLYNIITKNEAASPNPTITLYAHWNVITYTVTFDKNDNTSSGGLGSTTASRIDGLEDLTTTATFEQDFTMPALQRTGYNFRGYKHALMGESSGALNGFIGGEWTTGNTLTATLNKSLIDSTSIQLDDANRTCTIYAVWAAKVFNAYVNLNNSDLDGFADPETGDPVESFVFTVVNGATETEFSGVSYTNISVTWAFDKKISYLPNIIPTGYTFNGYKIQQDGTGDFILVNNTVLNYNLFNSANYCDSNGNLTNTSALYSGGQYKLSLYADYTVNAYTVALQSSSALSGYNLQEFTGNNKNNYTPAITSSINPVTVEHGKNLFIDIWAPAGKYIKKLTVSGNGWSQVFEFTWLSADKQVSYAGGNVGSAFSIISALTGKGAEKTYIKALYNEGVASDTPRLIFAMINLNESVTFTINTVDDQTYDVEFCRYAKGDGAIETQQNRLFTKTFKYNVILTSDNFAYPYTPGFVFKNWYYGSLNDVNVQDPSDGTLVNIDHDTVKENKVLVAYYEASMTKAQVVNFHIWDNIEGRYISRQDIDTHYQLYYYDTGTWKSTVGGDDVYFDDDGMNGTTVNERGGKLLTLPTPAAEIWPAGTYFAGYVISSSAPAADKYFSHLSGDNCIQIDRANEFDIDVMIEEQLNVYAVYDAYEFAITAGTKTGNNLNVTVNLELYEFKDGRTSQITYDSVYFAVLTNAQHGEYNSLITAGNTKEVALYAALGSNMTNAQHATGAETTVNVLGGSYVVAFVKGSNNLSKEYIYLASQNVLTVPVA